MGEFLSWIKQNNVSFEIVITTAALVLAAFFLILAFNRLLWRVLRTAEGRQFLDYETLLTITRSISILFWIVTGLLVLDLWGVNVGGVWTLLVSTAAVIGVGFLAVWTMISNITASVFISLWRPFHLGHTVELLPEQLKGRVIDRNMMFTVMRAEDGSLLQVPNNLFFQKIFRVTGNGEQSYFELLESQKPGNAAGMKGNNNAAPKAV